MLLDEIKKIREKSQNQRTNRSDNRWIAPYYRGLQDFKVGQHVWQVGTVGKGCDNCIWEEIITGEMQVDDMGGYLNFLTKNVSNNIGSWHRFGVIGCSIFFTKEEAEISLSERIKEVFENY
jgi:hypothetical protein